MEELLPQIKEQLEAFADYQLNSQEPHASGYVYPELSSLIKKLEQVSVETQQFYIAIEKNRAITNVTLCACFFL